MAKRPSRLQRPVPPASGSRHLTLRLDQVRRLVRLGRLDEASRAGEALRGDHPTDPDVLQVLLELCIQRSDWPGFRTHFEALIERNQHGAEIAAWDRGLLQLRLGEMPKGWDAFESRWDIPRLTGPLRAFTAPPWEGESFEGRTLLLHHEQGFGDTFMFCRYATLAKARGGRVVVEAQRPLADVVATCPGVDAVVAHGEPLPPFDCHLPLMSLPHIFQSELTTIPAEIPYLDVPAEVPNQNQLAGILAASKGRTRIGLAWAGSPTHKRDKDRSLPPRFLDALAPAQGVAWYSFQLDAPGQPRLPGIVPLNGWIRNFSDTAYALSGMDLVITVDTALAHLAGAMGIPTFLLVSFFPDFRWMMGREDSPWYPTFRVFRQPHPGDWAGVIADVGEVLGIRSPTFQRRPEP